MYLEAKRVKGEKYIHSEKIARASTQWVVVVVVIFTFTSAFKTLASVIITKV